MKMRRELALILVIAAATGPSCARSGSGASLPGASAPASGNHEGAADSPPWTIRYEAKCASGPQEKCRGAYGFLVRSNGLFELGPAADGQLLQGRLEAKDLASLALLVAREPVSNDNGREPAVESCEAAASPDVDDALSLERRGSAKAALRTEAERFCYSGTEAADVKAVREAVRGLLTKYAPEAFPNPCIDASEDLKKLYGQVSLCEKDADCAYLDAAYLPLEPGAEGRVTEDDCTYLPVLPVANGFGAVTNQLRLTMARELAEEVCHGQGTRPGCGRPVTFDTHVGVPICVHGACRVGPAAGI